MKAAWTLVALLPFCAFAQEVKKPAPGSALRKQVLDSLRPVIQKDLKQKVIFKVDDIRVYDGWAFVQVHPLQPNSKPIDFKKTKYKAALEDGVFDGSTTFALLKQSGKKWVVKDFVIGPTDVYWIGWMSAPHKAPKKLFPDLEGAG